MTVSEGGPRPVVDTSVPHSARTWNYWLGGKDNYAADREAGDAFAQMYPPISALVQQSRRFLVRTVEFLAETGTSQFLDIGTGLPVAQNTDDVAVAVDPGARVVYVDNDPMVLAHARALHTSPGVAFVDADIRDPARLLAEVGRSLDLTRPVAVMFLGVLGYVERYGDARRIVDVVLDAVPTGSHLVLWDATRSAAFSAAQEAYNSDTGGEPFYLREIDEIHGFFDGLDVLAPGVVPITEWRRDRIDADIAVDGYGGVALKP